MFFSKARRGMRHAALALVALCAISAPAFLAAQPALASTGGSDAPTPYTVDLNGITLPEGATFKDNGHINIETTSGKKTNTHFEAKCITRTDAECAGARHDAAQLIGKNFAPWSALGIDIETECVSWVQIHDYNQHFGEGGQKPVGKACGDTTPPVEEPPFTGVEKWSPSVTTTCETATFSHPEFRIAATQIKPENYTYQVTLNGTAGEVLAYTPGTVIPIPFENKFVKNTYAVTLWAHYADGKPFVKQQLGQIQQVSEPCEEVIPPVEEPKVAHANPPQMVDVCGTENDTVQIPSDTEEVFYTTSELDGVTTVTAHAREGIKLRSGEDLVDTLTWTFQFKNNEPCVEEVPPTRPPGNDIVFPPFEVEKPEKEGKTTPVASSDKQLAVTGGAGVMAGAAIGGALLLAGATIVVVRQVRKARV